MERNVLLTLLVTGCIVCIVGFLLAQFIPALIIVALIITTFLYSDFQESHKPGRKDLKKNATIAVFVIVTAYCMFTGLWIFWAGVTAILYIETLVDSLKEWLDARQKVDLDALNAMHLPVSENSLQSLRQYLFLIEQRMNVLELEKNK